MNIKGSTLVKLHKAMTKFNQGTGDVTLKYIFAVQKLKQEAFLGIATPVDNPEQFYFSATAAMVELGEAIQEDERWKALIGWDKTKHNKDAKLNELADVFMYVCNAVLFSGADYEQFMRIVADKQMKTVTQLYYKNQGKDKNEGSDCFID
jgi:NTP pyrophosphatase (non-canonical NTP hydrolase)